MPKKRKKRWDRWDWAFLFTLITAAVLKVIMVRIKANIIHQRFLFDFVTEVNGEAFFWETAPVNMQLMLGFLDLVSTFAFIVLLMSIGLLAGRMVKRAGWF